MTLIIDSGWTEGDSYFSNVSLLLHGNGANNSTTITDSSPSPKTVTAEPVIDQNNRPKSTPRKANLADQVYLLG